MKKILNGLNIEEEIIKDNEVDSNVNFVNFINTFLDVKKQTLEPITYNAYTKQAIQINNYFKNMRLRLKDIKPYHIEGFYKSLYNHGLSGNTVIFRQIYQTVPIFLIILAERSERQFYKKFKFL